VGEAVRETPGAWRIRISHHPMIDWVFGGAVLIAVGGLVSLSARARSGRPSEAAEASEAAVASPAGSGA